MWECRFVGYVCYVGSLKRPKDNLWELSLHLPKWVVVRIEFGRSDFTARAFTH